MASRSIRLFISVWLICLGNLMYAQTDSLDVAEQQSQVREMVNFYEYLLNTVGAEQTPTRDKEVIINQSYLKIFANEQVQIEDDLITDRKAIINKDVSSYFRDVDFFFQDIQFQFDSVSISLESGQSDPYYLVKFISVVSGQDLDGNSISQQQNRFLEVNVMKSSQDLKIASVYSTKISREKELEIWWNQLSSSWKSIFKEHVPHDSITNQILLRIASIDSLNISGESITEIAPLAALKRLKFLSLSQTGVTDINPLRFSKNLRYLSLNETPIDNISVLRFVPQLQTLDLSETTVTDISPLINLKLVHLNLARTEINDYSPLNSLSLLEELTLNQTDFYETQELTKLAALRKLDISNTGVTETEDFEQLKSLKWINLSNTFISDLSGFSFHPQIQTILVNNTSVESIDHIQSAPKLRRIEADFTNLSKLAAASFMQKRPQVIVITNSEEIARWWRELSLDWKEALAPNLQSPSDEALIQLLNQDTIDISNHRLIDGSPLKMFNRITSLDISQNLFTDFSFLLELTDLQELIAKKLPVSSTDGLGHLPLKKLVLSETMMTELTGVPEMEKLEYLDVDVTKIGAGEVKELLMINSNLLIIYKSRELLSWWNNLSVQWQTLFDQNNPDFVQLHQLTQQKEISIQNESISDLSPLSDFTFLEKLTLERTQVSSLESVKSLLSLKSLTITNGPLSDLEGINSLSQLIELDISNTAVDDLRPLENLITLESLNCAGTNIKRIKGLDQLKNLKYLNISNTRVWQLDRLYDIRALKHLECYNTRVRPHKIEAFRQQFPNCEITYY